MKKFAFSMIAGLALVQSTYGATSALTESLLEYEAITSAIGSNPSFENIIGPAEFIVDIRRITKQIDILGKVKYQIVTRLVNSKEKVEGVEAYLEPERLFEAHSQKSSEHKHHKANLYIATLLVSPNPGIGPNIVTVEKIKKVRIRTTQFLENEKSL